MPETKIDDAIAKDVLRLLALLVYEVQGLRRELNKQMTVAVKRGALEGTLHRKGGR